MNHTPTHTHIYIYIIMIDDDNDGQGKELPDEISTESSGVSEVSMSRRVTGEKGKGRERKTGGFGIWN
jgi:hypothetical protein